MSNPIRNWVKFYHIGKEVCISEISLMNKYDVNHTDLETGFVEKIYHSRRIRWFDFE
jgi:hypothetical protein